MHRLTAARQLATLLLRQHAYIAAQCRVNGAAFYMTVVSTRDKNGSLFFRQLDIAYPPTDG